MLNRHYSEETVDYCSMIGLNVKAIYNSYLAEDQSKACR